jgi:hypothetical protein
MGAARAAEERFAIAGKEAAAREAVLDATVEVYTLIILSTIYSIYGQYACSYPILRRCLYFNRKSSICLTIY